MVLALSFLASREMRGWVKVLEKYSPLVDDLSDLLDFGGVVLLVGGDEVLGQLVEIVHHRLELVHLGVEGLENKF